VRIGRHEGDWELFQVRVGAGGRPGQATFAQHTWAEGCAWRDVERAGGAPVVFVAKGLSCALYPSGADGRGRTVRPRLIEINEDKPAWMRWPGTFGSSEAGLILGERSSPRGPALQRERWDDPGSFDEREARPCAAGPPGRPWQTALLIGLALLAGLGLLWRRRRAWRSPDLQSPR
jgi:LPXTG-motif cell wall-anchored protein